MKHLFLIISTIFLSIGLKVQDIKAISNKFKTLRVLIVTYDSNHTPATPGSVFILKKEFNCDKFSYNRRFI